MAKATTPPVTAITKWDEELAKEAAIAAGMEQSATGGNFFKTKSGVLTFGDMPLKDNQVGAIVVDHILENVLYIGKYDPDNPTSPECFAFGRDEAKLAPHPNVVAAKQNPLMDPEKPEGPRATTCAECPMNKWGSADTGKGKACKNTRRLALISAGTFNGEKFELVSGKDQEEYFKTTPIGYLKPMVTSVKAFATYVTQAAGAMGRPPHGLVTKIKLEPDVKNQFKLTFTGISKVPDSIQGIIMARNKASKDTIEFPYQLGGGEDEVPKKQDRSAPSAPKGAKKRKY